MSYLIDGIRYINKRAVYECRTCNDRIDRTKRTCICGAVHMSTERFGTWRGDPTNVIDHSSWVAEGRVHRRKQLEQHVVQQLWDAKFKRSNIGSEIEP
jgi:hypothetical protein